MILFIFIDGLGINKTKKNNPLFDEDLIFLKRIVHEDSKPINAKMGVDGIPQSATGQSSIFTGRNCSKILGYHKEGFPNGRLKKLLKKESIFQYFTRKGLKTTFANGYIVDDKDFLLNSRFVSATTFMTLLSTGKVRGLKKLNNGEAVYQDITNETLVKDDDMKKRYSKLYPNIKNYINFNQLSSVKKITPEKAGDNLLKISYNNDLTLFEYFLSDKAGHSGDYDKSRKMLFRFQRLLKVVHQNMNYEDDTLIMVSDHGNIEDLSVSSHTYNPVPLLVKGKLEYLFDGVSYIYDIAPVLKNYAKKKINNYNTV